MESDITSDYPPKNLSADDMYETSYTSQAKLFLEDKQRLSLLIKKVKHYFIVLMNGRVLMNLCVTFIK